MAKKQSMAEALKKNKRLRETLNTATDDLPKKPTLTVVSGDADQSLEEAQSETHAEKATDTPVAPGQPLWVRHTLGLRPQTSMDLRDATDIQKKKKRRGTLKPGEPANEQEIADLGINWALGQIGFKRSGQG